jgi:amino acid transporter
LGEGAESGAGAGAPSPRAHTLPGAPEPEPEPLKRELSRLAIAALAINGIVGAGIFGLPADAAQKVGAFSPVIFIVCGLLMTTLMASLAQASSYFRGTGGPVLYVQTAFGPFAGFQTGWVLWVGRVTSLAANANVLAKYAVPPAPGEESTVWRIPIIAALTAGFAWLNIVGVKQGIGALMAITVVKLVPLCAFVLVGLAFLRTEPFTAAEVPSYEMFGDAMILVFYAFIGFEGALIPAGESRDPKRDMPRAMFLVAGIATLLYVLIQTVSVAVLPGLATSKRPLADAAGVMMGTFGVTLISLGAIVSVLGNFGASVLSAPRMTYALAREGSLPAWLGRVHARYKTPHASILAYCALGFVLGATGTFQGLAVMSSLARLVGYVVSVATLPRLRKRFGHAPGAIRLPGGLAIPIVAVVVCLWLIAQVSFEAVWKTGALIAVGAVLYLVARFAGRSKGTENTA